MSPQATYLKRQQYLLDAARNGHNNHLPRTEVAVRMRNLRRVAAEIIGKGCARQPGEGESR